MDISAILTYQYPGSIWYLNGTDYEGLVWQSDTPKPEKEELEALWPMVQYQIAYEYAEKMRAIGYAANSDPIFFQYQRGEKTQQEWLDAVEAVKSMYPYPEMPSK